MSHVGLATVTMCSLPALPRGIDIMVSMAASLVVPIVVSGLVPTVVSVAPPAGMLSTAVPIVAALSVTIACPMVAVVVSVMVSGDPHCHACCGFRRGR